MYHSILTGRMIFLTPNQQRQSTEGKALKVSVWLWTRLFATKAANIKIEKTDRQTDNYVQRLQKRKQREKQLQTRHSNTGKLTENNFMQGTSIIT